jgi:hypothetical protein
LPQSSHKTMKKNNMIKSTKKKETMKNKPQITILFGTNKDVKKTYVFEDETQKAFFIKGVDEANGYLEYEIQEDKFITQRNK